MDKAAQSTRYGGPIITLYIVSSQTFSRTPGSVEILTKTASEKSKKIFKIIVDIINML